MWPITIKALAVAVLAACGPVDEPPAMPGLKHAPLLGVQKIACPKSAVGCAEVGAVYGFKTSTIVVPDTWDRLNLYDRSLLLHEFVHHLQWLRGDAEKRCMGDLEKEAYAVQAAFLKANGVAHPLVMMGMDELTLMVTTMCRRM